MDDGKYTAELEKWLSVGSEGPVFIAQHHKQMDIESCQLKQIDQAPCCTYC